MPGPEELEPLASASAPGSHLYPGATLLIEEWPDAPFAALRPLGLRIAFLDGSTAAAEVYGATGRAEFALVVEPYTTAAGRALPRKAWRVASAELHGAGLALRLGAKLALENFDD